MSIWRNECKIPDTIKPSQTIQRCSFTFVQTMPVQLILQTPVAARDISFGDQWCTTTTCDNFTLIDDITEGGSRTIVFGTLANLQRLCSSSVVSMDGTFKVCPRLFYQLYIIYSHCYNTVLTELFCLLQDKLTTTYHRLFTLIQS